jgi:NADP-dependent 3-hydroxy acid dehydrogenase YdfG
VVTGASRGIGAATARALAESGARVALIARDAATLERLAEELGERAFAVPCAVNDAAAVAAVTRSIAQRFGGTPDILVNNAGAFTLAPVEDISPAQFLDTIGVNLVAPFLFTHAYLRAMRERRSGHIVTVGSIADRMVFPENGAYAASKHGVRALHEVLRTELRGSGVRASLVSPGPVNTTLWDPVDPDNRAGFTPRAAMLSPVAVAEAILFVLTARAELNVDEIRVSRS